MTVKTSAYCKNNLKIESLNGTSFSSIAQYFNQTFEGYMLPVSMTEHSIEDFCTIRSVDLKRSFILPAVGKFDEHNPVGLILNAFSLNNKHAYNAGMAIRPGFRGKGLGMNMLNAVISIFRRTGILTYTLEVIDTNKNAEQLYRNLGFLPVRHFSVFYAHIDDIKANYNQSVQRLTIKKHFIEINSVKQMCKEVGWEPSWQNNISAILRSAHKFSWYTLHKEKNLRAFLLIDEHGSIGHGWFSRSSGLSDIAWFLYKTAKTLGIDHLSWTNVESFSYEASVLHDLNFQCPVGQWEMKMQII